MPTPFPGMDPYLERPGIWQQVHAHTVITTIEILSPANKIGCEGRWQYEDKRLKVLGRRSIMAEEHTPTLESETLLNLIKQRYGGRLTPAELEEVRKGVDGIAQAASALRSVALDNGDEPFSIFVPYRQEGSD